MRFVSNLFPVLYICLYIIVYIVKFESRSINSNKKTSRRKCSNRYLHIKESHTKDMYEVFVQKRTYIGISRKKRLVTNGQTKLDYIKIDLQKLKQEKAFSFIIIQF